METRVLILHLERVADSNRFSDSIRLSVVSKGHSEFISESLTLKLSTKIDAEINSA